MARKKSSIRDMHLKIKFANKLLVFVGNCGREFFKYEDEHAKFEMNVSKANNRLYYRDEYTKALIYVNRDLANYKIYKFSHGGTLKGFINELSHFIRFDGYKLDYRGCGIDNESYWAYGDDGMRVVNEAVRLGIMDKEEKK